MAFKEPTISQPKTPNPQKLELLTSRLSSIGNLPSTVLKKEVFGFSKTQSNSLKPEALAEIVYLMEEENNGNISEKTVIKQEEIFVLLEQLFLDKDSANNLTIIRTVKEWLATQDKTKINYVQDAIVNIIKRHSSLGLSSLLLLGELKNQEGFFISDELFEAIENNIKINAKFIFSQSGELLDQLALLNRFNLPETNLILHKILDYLTEHLITLQNKEVVGEDSEQYGFIVDLLYRFVLPEDKHSKNYLIKKHFQDLIETFQSYSDKKGKIAGLSGGASDLVIYQYAVAEQSYQNLLASGIQTQGVLTEPLLPIAPGYFGHYQKGTIHDIYELASEDGSSTKSAKEIEAELTKNNDPKFDYIYGILNEPLSSVENYHDSFRESNKLENLWDFFKKIKEQKQNFFFDCSRINFCDLDPIVKGEILFQNYEYFKRQKRTNSKTPKPESKENFVAKVFPLNNFDEKKLYSYLYLSQLQMRKKIQDDFGVEIADFDFAVQRHFLNFLETRSLEDVQELQNFVAQYGANGIKTFFSLEFDEISGDKIISIGENLADEPELAGELFAEYSQLADKAKEAAKDITEAYTKIFEIKKNNEDEIYQAILKRASRLLTDTQEKLNAKKINLEAKKVIIKEIIVSLHEEEKMQNETFAEFQKLVKKLNEQKDLAKESTPEMLLSLEDRLAEKFNQIARGEFHPDTDKKIIAKYQEIKESAGKITATISASFGDVKMPIDPNKVADDLLREAANIISTSTATESDRRIAIKKLEAINTNILLIIKILSQIPREEIGQLDLKKIPPIEKIENLPVAELLNQPEILNQIKAIVKAQFPVGDEAVFEDECRNNPDLKINISLADKKILSFFTEEKKSTNIRYIDWFLANPDAPIKGLGEATLRLSFDSPGERKKSFYAVSKPQGKAFQILIENLGYVAFAGSTEDREYKHHYSRIRRFPNDQNYISKKLSREDEVLLKDNLHSLCSTKNKTEDLIFRGSPLRAVKVIFHGQTHHDDIKKTDPDGWLMREIDNQKKKGMVLTRFISESQNKDNQTYYAVFEKDQANRELVEELEGVISAGLSSDHSAPKKALSN